MTDVKVSLVCVPDQPRLLDWSSLSRPDHRVIEVGNATLLSSAICSGLLEGSNDIERVIFDRTLDSSDFLRLIAQLPTVFRGDVLLVDAGGDSYLSSSARGEGRLLYALAEYDVDFYIEANFLTSAPLVDEDRVVDWSAVVA